MSLKWLSQKDMARKLGVCVNTFIKYYRPLYPPTTTRGFKLYWSSDYAEKIVQEISQSATAQPNPPTTTST